MRSRGISSTLPMSSRAFSRGWQIRHPLARKPWVLPSGAPPALSPVHGHLCSRFRGGFYRKRVPVAPLDIPQGAGRRGFQPFRAAWPSESGGFSTPPGIGAFAPGNRFLCSRIRVPFLPDTGTPRPVSGYRTLGKLLFHIGNSNAKSLKILKDSTTLSCRFKPRKPSETGRFRDETPALSFLLGMDVR